MKGLYFFRVFPERSSDGQNDHREYRMLETSDCTHKEGKSLPLVHRQSQIFS